MEFSPDLKEICNLASSTSSAVECSALVIKAISHKNIFAFGELLQIPSIIELKNSNHAASFATLELFAYGTFQDYKNTPEIFCSLDTNQIKKLKQLSLITLATSQHQLPYSYLSANLDVADIRELEDIIIEAIYNGLISGRLNQKAQLLIIHEVGSRDVRFNDIENLINQLQLWKQKCNNLAAACLESTEMFNHAREKSAKEQEAIQNNALSLYKAVKETYADLKGSDFRHIHLAEGHDDFHLRAARGMFGGKKSSGKRSRGMGGVDIRS